MQLDKHVLRNSTILLIALIIPFNAIHELGHLIPCVASGGQGTFLIGIIASQASCSLLTNSMVFAFAGGALATLSAFIPLLILNKVHRLNNYPSLKIVFISFGLGHFMTALLETLARDFYMSDIATPIVSFATFTIYIVILSMFGRTDKLRKDKWITSKEAGDLLKRNSE
jgi:hypothetical protein